MTPILRMVGALMAWNMLAGEPITTHVQAMWDGLERFVEEANDEPLAERIAFVHIVRPESREVEIGDVRFRLEPATVNAEPTLHIDVLLARKIEKVAFSVTV